MFKEAVMSVRLVGLRLLKLAGLLAAVLLPIAITPSMRAQQAPVRPGGAAGGFNRAQPEPIDWDNHEGWASLFDGKTLNGWDGPSDVWHYADGAIVGESSDANPSGTTNII